MTDKYVIGSRDDGGIQYAKAHVAKLVDLNTADPEELGKTYRGKCVLVVYPEDAAGVGDNIAQRIISGAGSDITVYVLLDTSAYSFESMGKPDAIVYRARALKDVDALIMQSCQ